MSSTTIDHDEIRKWAESKGGKPAAVDRTHSDSDVGIIRIMFPDAPNSQHDALTEISWDEFFEEFEDRGLALIYDKKSLFSKLIGRDTAEKREHGDNNASRHADRGAASKTPAKSTSGDKSAKGATSDDKDMKAREYKDVDGTVHHHTKAYMEQHRGG